jgi:hypothetical protein
VSPNVTFEDYVDKMDTRLGVELQRKLMELPASLEYFLNSLRNETHLMASGSSVGALAWGQ